MDRMSRNETWIREGGKKVSHFYSMQAWLLAPTYVLVGEPIDSRSGKLTTLDDGSLVALFTSTESAREFAETYYAEEDISRFNYGMVNALGFAGWLEALEEIGVKVLVFDPVATSVGRWTDQAETVTVSYYRHFAAELGSGLENLVAEAYADARHEFGNPPNVSRMSAWCESRVDSVIEDVRARAAEWETKDDS
jgi:hypothetical protein